MNRYRTDAPTAASAWKHGAMFGFYTGYMSGANDTLNNATRTAKATSKTPPNLEAAKTAIKAFFESKHGEEIDYIDLAEHFDFSLVDIVSACDELEKEHKIACVD